MDESKLPDQLPDDLYPKLSDEHITRLSHAGIRRTVARGEILFEQGSIGRHFYVLLKGTLEAVLPDWKNAVGVSDFKYLSYRGACTRDTHPAAAFVHASAADQHPQSGTVDVVQPGQIDNQLAGPAKAVRPLLLVAARKLRPRLGSHGARI